MRLTPNSGTNTRLPSSSPPARPATPTPEDPFAGIDFTPAETDRNTSRPADLARLASLIEAVIPDRSQPAMLTLSDGTEVTLVFEPRNANPEPLHHAGATMPSRHADLLVLDDRHSAGANPDDIPCDDEIRIVTSTFMAPSPSPTPMPTPRDRDAGSRPADQEDRTAQTTTNRNDRSGKVQSPERQRQHAARKLVAAILDAQKRGQFADSTFESSIKRYVDCSTANALAVSDGQRPVYRNVKENLIIEFDIFVRNPHFKTEVVDADGALAPLKSLGNSVSWAFEKSSVANDPTANNTLLNLNPLELTMSITGTSKPRERKKDLTFSLDDLQSMTRIAKSGDLRQTLADQSGEKNEPARTNRNSNADPVRDDVDSTILSSLSSSFASMRSIFESRTDDSGNPGYGQPGNTARPPK